VNVFRIDVTLKEPLTLGITPAVGNEVDTLGFIPATSLRGAIAASLFRSGNSHLVEKWFGVNGPRWTPALPMASAKKPCVPMPASFLREKSDDSQGIRNIARVPIPDTPGAQWKRMTAPWIVLEGGHDPVPKAKTAETHMHLALHYARHANRESALFSRSAIDPADQKSFRAFVFDETETITKELLERRVFLGKRRSAGNGAAELRATRLDAETLVYSQKLSSDGRYFIQLLSDAIVVGADGGLQRTLSDADIRQALGINDVVVSQGFSTSASYPGWSNTWGVPRESAGVIHAGAVYELESKHPDFANRIMLLAQHGIGIRRNEGFGWVAVNPDWLTFDRMALPEKGTGAVGPKHAWPGFKLEQSEALVPLAQAAAKLRNIEIAHLRAVASVAQHSAELTAVKSFVAAMAHRANTRKWDETARALNGVLSDKDTDMPRLRFFLEAAIVYAQKGDAA